MYVSIVSRAMPYGPDSLGWCLRKKFWILPSVLRTSATVYESINCKNPARKTSKVCEARTADKWFHKTRSRLQWREYYRVLCSWQALGTASILDLGFLYAVIYPSRLWFEEWVGLVLDRHRVWKWRCTLSPESWQTLAELALKRIWILLPWKKNDAKSNANA